MQEVNLLSEELKPQYNPLSLKEFAIALGALTIVLAAITSWQAYSLWDINNSLHREKSELLAASQQLNRLENHAERQADPALVQQLAALVKRREEQRQLVTVLEKEPMNSGFQGHLRDLASIDMRNLWFESIALTQGGRQIHMTGFSKAAEQVPLFLSMLSKGKAFSGYRFDGLEIERKTDVLVAFEVHGPIESTNL